MNQQIENLTRRVEQLEAVVKKLLALSGHYPRRTEDTGYVIHYRPDPK